MPEALRDLQRFKAPATVIDSLARRLDGDFDGIWPENLLTVHAFLAVSTQWRTAPVGAHGATAIFWVGLDYAAARASLDAYGFAVTPELWSGLQIMEAEARAALNAHR